MMPTSAIAAARGCAALLVLSAIDVALRAGQAPGHGQPAVAQAFMCPAGPLASTTPSFRRRGRSRWASRVTRNPLPDERLQPQFATAVDAFDEAVIAGRLEHDHKADLASLAAKYGAMIESADGIEEVHIAQLDRECMQLDVVYCDRRDSTCVAIAVPIKFPRICHDETAVLDALQDLEGMDSDAIGMETQVPEVYVNAVLSDPLSYFLSFLLSPIQKRMSQNLVDTIARICAVMNQDFQDELANFVRAFGGKNAARPTGLCEMVSLTPDGFAVQAALFPDEPVHVSFPAECLSAGDFQEQILALSEQAMTLV